MNNIYIIASDDILLKSDREDEIVKQWRQKLPEAISLLFSYEDFKSSSDSNLTVLENELMDPGLFGGDRIIKIYLKDFDKVTVDIMMLLAQRNRDGIVVILDLPRILSSYQKIKPAPFVKEKTKGKIEERKKKALSYLFHQGASLEILYPPEGDALIDYIAKRVQKYGLTIDREALNFLSLSCEGNLISIDQSLKQIALASKIKNIDMNTIVSYFNEDSRYTGFEFSEALFSGNSKKALNILNSCCNSQGSSKQSALNLLLSNVDKTLYAVKKMREEKIQVNNYQAKIAFFKPLGILVPNAQKAISYAAINMPDKLLDYITQELAKASIAYCNFNENEAYLAIQRCVVACANFKVFDFKPL